MLKSKLPEIIAELPLKVREAEKAAAELIVQSAKERVPVDPNTTKHLRDHIHTEEAPEGVWVRAGNNKFWYGHIIEHGSVNQPARPFLVPALEENRSEILATFSETIRRVV